MAEEEELVDGQPKPKKDVSLEPPRKVQFEEPLQDGARGSVDIRLPSPTRRPAQKRKPDAGPVHDDESDLKVRLEEVSSDDGMANAGGAAGSDEFGSPPRGNINMDAHETSTATMDSDMDMIAMSTEDKKVVAGVLLGVDMTEIYSPIRVAKVCIRMGLTPGSSTDLTSGFDFTKISDRERAWKRITTEKPFIVIGSPPCTKLSILQELCKAVHGDKPGWMDKHKLELEEATKHVECCAAISRYQMSQGRHFLHGHPWTAKSWQIPVMERLLEDDRVILVEAHQCMYGLETYEDAKGGSTGAAKKPAGFMTSAWHVAEQLKQRCDGSHSHVPLMGGRAAGAAIHPLTLCQAICRGIIQQKKFEKGGNISTCAMQTGSLCSFVNKLCEGESQGRVMTKTLQNALAHKNSYKVPGNWPEHWVDFVHEEDGGDDARGIRPQCGTELLKEQILELTHGDSIAWDDVSGASLIPEKVVEARQEEMKYFKEIGVYTRVPRAHQWTTGWKTISVKWIDVNKGDSEQTNSRSHLVCR